MTDLDAIRILEEVGQHQVPAEWTVFSASKWFFVRQGVNYLVNMLLSVFCFGVVVNVVNSWQKLAIYQDPGDVFTIQCVFVLFVASILGFLAAAVYQFWSMPKARDQVLVVTPDGFVTNTRRQRFSVRHATLAVAFADLRGLTFTRQFFLLRKSLDLRFTGPMVSMPGYWMIPRQFVSDHVIGQTIIDAYTRYRQGTPLHSSPTGLG
jgi:hypothetical protein